MAGETVFAQIIHEAPSASRKTTALIPVCSICGLLRDDTPPALDQERWVTQRAYRKLHNVHPADCVLAHTYCPTCFTRVIE